jgi:hypothetical protein
MFPVSLNYRLPIAPSSYYKWIKGDNAEILKFETRCATLWIEPCEPKISSNSLMHCQYIVSIYEVFILQNQQVGQCFATGLWFSLGIQVSSTNKNDHHDITEILLKLVITSG